MNHWKSTLAVIGIGQLISILTSTIVGFSIIFWISNEFKSPTALSLAILAGFLPQFVLGLFTGVYVDRWNRKKTMFYSDLFIAFCTLCLFIVITKGYKDLSFFYLLTACRSIGSTFHAPALQASIPLLVPKHHLVRVSGLYHSIQSFSEVIAPVVGASLVVWLPIQYILLIDVIGAVAACLTLLCVQIPSLQKTKVLPDFKKELTECWHTLRGTMGILPLFVCFTLVTFVLMPVFTLFPFMTLLHFNGNILQMGVVEMGWGSGALLGGLVLACKALKSKQTLVMHTAYVILGLYLISASYLPSSAFIGFVCLTFTGGIAYSIYHALFIAIIQQNLASDMLGRTFSLIFSLSTFPSMLGIVASGYWVEAWGITSVFMISGWVIFLIGVGANFISSIKQLDNYA